MPGLLLDCSVLMVPSNHAQFGGTAYSGARVLVNDDGRSSSVTGAAREDPSVDDRKHSSVQSSGSTRRESNVGGLKLARVSQTRIYYPGQSYETDDLAPRERFEVDAHTPTQKTRRAPVKGKEIDKHLLAALISERATAEPSLYLRQEKSFQEGSRDSLRSIGKWSGTSRRLA